MLTYSLVGVDEFCGDGVYRPGLAVSVDNEFPAKLPVVANLFVDVCVGRSEFRRWCVFESEFEQDALIGIKLGLDRCHVGVS